MNKINFAIIAMMVSVPAFAAGTDGICGLISRLQDVFKFLRTLAFIGAAFYIAQWAWDFIKAGDAKVDDLKKKGIGLLTGFIMLFSIGILLSFVLSATGGQVLGCVTDGWN